MRFIFGETCIFHIITGLYCPGCGMTRCVLSIIHGNFYQAFRYNPLGFIALFILFIYFIYFLICKITQNKMLKIPKYIEYLLLVIILIYSIIRNLECFDWLQPTKIF
ncbi:MAG: DUF2752 domain-containing protein [Bacilli bacterium]